MRLRAPRLEDAEAAFEVIEARDRADLGFPDFRLEDVRDEWRRSDIDLAADARLVEDERRSVVGYGIVEDQGAWGVVRPDAEGRGAGTLLLRWLMERERERGHAMHRQYVAAANQTAPILLAAHGFKLARSNHRMVASLQAPLKPVLPPEVTLRPPQAEDLEAIHALDARAFAADPGYVEESLTRLREEHFEAHDAAPDLSRLALTGDRVVGFLLARRRSTESVGYVDVLAVDPDHQGRGIGRALLLNSFAAFATDGLKEAQLGVSSANPRALRLYESAGMTLRFRSDIYERPI